MDPIPIDPVNIEIMDVPQFIFESRAQPVTSSLIYNPSSNIYNENGLYSEEIFGSIGSPERMLKFGYIDLNTQIFNPKIFKLIVQLKSLYKDIMNGTAYAIFDPVLKDFKRVVNDDPTNYSVGTGFSFFLKHFRDIEFRRTESSRRDDRIGVVEMYRDRIFIDKFLVEPAGLRDISTDTSGRLVQDDINKLYTSLLLYSRSIPKGSVSAVYDPVRYQIQSKAQEIYEYIENFIDGKRGFIQGNFARRKIAMGTRNVITATTYIAHSPEDPQIHGVDDVMIGVYQCIKGLTPYFKYIFRTTFINPVFKSESSANIALSDPKTGELVYTTISPDVREKWTSSDGIDDLINSFRNTDLRSKPVFIRDTEGKDYAMYFIYDDGDEIGLCRSASDIKENWPIPFNPKKLRPITYIELFYIVAEVISFDKHGIVTRYPVIEQGSSYPAKIHVVSTSPSRYVEMINLVSPDGARVPLKQYPVKGGSYMDAMMVHPSKMSGMGADRRISLH